MIWSQSLGRFLFLVRRYSLPLSSAFLGLAVALSAGRYALNLWDLAWRSVIFYTTLLTLISGGCSLAVLKVGRRWFTGLERSKKTAWLVAALAVGCLLLAGSLLAGKDRSLPASQHILEINAVETPREIRLLEIHAPNGERVRFEDTSHSPNWEESDNIFIAPSDGHTWLRYPFESKVGEHVEILFETFPDGGSITANLDGRALKPVNLREDPGGYAMLYVPVERTSLPAAVRLVIYGFDLLAFSWVALILLVFVFVYGERRPIALLGVLLAAGLFFHILSMLTTPLKVYPDSHGYLMGAQYLAKNWTFDGLPLYRPLGWSLLFGPFFMVFGRNPWGIKLFLHFLGLGCVFLAYGIGWQLVRKHWFAFLCGFSVIMTPDIVIYSNVALSELLMAFLVLLFMYFGLKYLTGSGLRWLYFSLITGIFLVLLRLENLALVLVFGLLVIGQFLQSCRQGQQPALSIRRFGSHIIIVGILAALPVTGWLLLRRVATKDADMAHYNQVVWYDAWIYFGEAYDFPITDHNSLAVQTIQQAYTMQEEAGKRAGADESAKFGNTWYDYANLTLSGYTPGEAAEIMYRAAMDSIIKSPWRTIQLYLLKLETAFALGGGNYWDTAPLPGEHWVEQGYGKSNFFDDDAIPASSEMIQLQRDINNLWYILYESKPFYGIWLWAGLISAAVWGFGLLHRPVFPWLFLAWVIFARVELIYIAGYGLPRYLVPGVALLNISALAAVFVLLQWITTSALNAFGRASR